MLTEFRERQAAASGAGGARGGTDAAFVAQILRDGTHQDKLSALILLVRESPLHRMAELDRLKAMAGGSSGGGLGGREEKVATLRAVADWWVSGGGKQAGKLRYLADQPMLGHQGVTDRHLLLWAFEDWLKKWFFSILQILEVSPRARFESQRDSLDLSLFARSSCTTPCRSYAPNALPSPSNFSQATPSKSRTFCAWASTSLVTMKKRSHPRPRIICSSCFKTIQR